jgi:hypothetical protein
MFRSKQVDFGNLKCLQRRLQAVVSGGLRPMLR